MPVTSSPIAQGVPLKRRVFTASAWNLAGYGVSLTIRFGSNLIMTRLLVPEMFGVMAIATIVMVGLAMFSDLGLRQSIVQSRRGSDAAFLNTAWMLQILRGLVLWIAALIISEVLYYVNSIEMVPRDSVYSNPILPWVIAVLSFGTVISGFESTKLSEANRNLEFGRITQIEISTQIVGMICMLGWAAFDRSIWALVLGGIVAMLLRTVLSHVWMAGNNNRWQWDRPAFLELVHFGKWIFLSSTLGFLVNSGDRLLLGWLVDSTVLGIYVIAYLIFGSIEQILTRIIDSVALPAFSEIARNQRDLKPAYYRFHTVIAAIAYFSAGALMISGEVLIDLLYDQRYSDAGWILKILAVALLAIPFRTTTQCFVALELPQLLLHVGGARLTALYLFTPICFYFFGLPGAIWCISLSNFSWLPIAFYFTARRGLLDLSKELALLAIVPLGAVIGLLFNAAVGRIG